MDGRRGQPERTTRSKKVLFALLTVLGSLVMFCIGLEIVLRLVGYTPAVVNPLGNFHQHDPLLGHRGKASFVGRWKRPEFDVMIVHDADGFRAQKETSIKEKCNHDVFVFGDSFVWGWGVDQGETLTDQMQTRLPAHCIHNRGINAAGTVMEYRLFEAEVAPSLKQGDLVLVLFFNNDFGDNINPGAVHGEVEEGVVRIKSVKPYLTTANGMLENSYAYKFVSYQINLLTLVRKRKQLYPERDITIAEDDPRLVVTRHVLHLFKEKAEERQAQFLAVYIPGQMELQEGDLTNLDKLGNERVYRRAFFALAESVGVRTLDLLPAFLQYKKEHSSSRLTFDSDEHWNPLGHRVAAQAISTQLSALPQ